MTRLPAVSKLTVDLRQTRTGRRGQTVATSVDFLVDRRAALAAFEGIEDLAISSDPQSALPGTSDETIATAKGLAHHLTSIRREIVKSLWAEQIFVDVDVIDELLYFAIVDHPAEEPVGFALRWIRDTRATRPGLLIFPIHSLSVLAGGLSHLFGQPLTFIRPDLGCAIAPQTNSMDGTLAFLDECRAGLGIAQAIPVEQIRHWRRSRPTAWLERNPLLVIRTVRVPGGYYGGESLLMTRVRATTAALTMLAAMQEGPPDRGGLLFSTAMTNNQQTLDLHHYITLYSGWRRHRELSGYCVPIHDSRSYVAELSDLAIEIDPRQWRRRPAMAAAISQAVEVTYTRYLRQRFEHRTDARSRTARKMFDSLAYFRRSNQRSTQVWGASISLATAFEMLLTDHYGDPSGTIARRTQILLRGVRGTEALQHAVRTMYTARSELVHQGNEDVEVDLVLARQAYVRCFIALSDRFESIDPGWTQPIGQLLDDRPRRRPCQRCSQGRADASANA